MAATAKPARQWDRMILRLPDGMKTEIEDRAADNCRAINGEIVFLIKRGIAAEKAASAVTA